MLFLDFQPSKKCTVDEGPAHSRYSEYHVITAVNLAVRLLEEILKARVALISPYKELATSISRSKGVDASGQVSAGSKLERSHL